jgi:hypothetical protein
LNIKPKVNPSLQVAGKSAADVALEVEDAMMQLPRPLSGITNKQLATSLGVSVVSVVLGLVTARSSASSPLMVARLAGIGLTPLLLHEVWVRFRMETKEDLQRLAAFNPTTA